MSLVDAENSVSAIYIAETHLFKQLSIQLLLCEAEASQTLSIGTISCYDKLVKEFASGFHYVKSNLIVE